MSQLQTKRELPASFYEQLDVIVSNEKSTRDAFNKAVAIAKQHGLSDTEVVEAIKDYMKDRVPKSTLYDWTRPLSVGGPVRKQSVRREESSIPFVDATKKGTEEDHIYKIENPTQEGIQHVRLSDAINVLLDARRDGYTSGDFYWKGDSPK